MGRLTVGTRNANNSNNSVDAIPVTPAKDISIDIPAPLEIEKIVYVDRIVIKEITKEVPVEIEKIIFKEIKTDHFVDRPVEIEKQVFIDKIVEVEKQVLVEKPIHIYKEVFRNVHKTPPWAISALIIQGIIILGLLIMHRG